MREKGQLLILLWLLARAQVLELSNPGAVFDGAFPLPVVQRAETVERCSRRLVPKFASN